MFHVGKGLIIRVPATAEVTSVGVDRDGIVKAATPESTSNFSTMSQQPEMNNHNTS